MTLFNAIHSGKPFKRAYSSSYFAPGQEPVMGFSLKDIQADDWELFDDSLFDEKFTFTAKQLVDLMWLNKEGTVDLTSSFAGRILKNAQALKNSIDTNLKLL